MHPRFFCDFNEPIIITYYVTHLVIFANITAIIDIIRMFINKPTIDLDTILEESSLVLHRASSAVHALHPNAHHPLTPDLSSLPVLAKQWRRDRLIRRPPHEQYGCFSKWPALEILQLSPRTPIAAKDTGGRCIVHILY